MPNSVKLGQRRIPMIRAVLVGERKEPFSDFHELISPGQRMISHSRVKLIPYSPNSAERRGAFHSPG